MNVVTRLREQANRSTTYRAKAAPSLVWTDEKDVRHFFAFVVEAKGRLFIFGKELVRLNNRIILVCILLLIVIIGSVIVILVNSQHDYHQELNTSEIRSVNSWSDYGSYELNAGEVDSMVTAFNGAQPSRANDNYEGITPSYGIRIVLSSGGNITINEAESSYGSIEVQRDLGTRHVSYRINDSKLEEFLKAMCFSKMSID